MVERYSSLNDGLVISRVEKREDLRWKGLGYAIFSGTGNLMGRCDDLLSLEGQLVQSNVSFRNIEKPYNFWHKGQRMRYVPVGPVSTRVLSWLMSWRYL